MNLGWIKSKKEEEEAKQQAIMAQLLNQMGVYHQFTTSSPGHAAGLASVATRKPCLDPTKVAALQNVEPRKAMPKMPDLVECITGYRVWTVSDNKLRSLVAGVIWPPKKPIVAACSSLNVWVGYTSHLQQHEAPVNKCECGVWALKSVEKLMEGVNGDGYPEVSVLGKVSLWGRVIECEHGWRAQYAYPSELWLMSPELEELGITYGVPVRVLEV